MKPHFCGSIVLIELVFYVSIYRLGEERRVEVKINPDWPIFMTIIASFPVITPSFGSQPAFAREMRWLFIKTEKQKKLKTYQSTLFRIMNLIPTRKGGQSGHSLDHLGIGLRSAPTQFTWLWWIPGHRETLPQTLRYYDCVTYWSNKHYQPVQTAHTGPAIS